VLCSDFGMLYTLSDPYTAVSLFRQGVEVAGDERQRKHNELDVLVTTCLDLNAEFDTHAFDQIWNSATKNRFSGISTRAGLFRAAICMQDQDLAGARRWLQRAQSGVNLYQMRFLTPYLRNDQLVLALLDNDEVQARRHLIELAQILQSAGSEVARAATQLPQLLEQCQVASGRLQRSDSPFRLPDAPPAHCDRFAELRRNVGAAAHLLREESFLNEFSTWLQPPPAQAPSVHYSRRQIDICGYRFTLGAH
jgi:hypothetical protein